MRTLVLSLVLVLVACEPDTPGRVIPAPYDPSASYQPLVTEGDLESPVNNPFFVAIPGDRWVYEARGPDGTERIEVEALAASTPVWGVEGATVLHSVVTRDGQRVAESRDVYAQDVLGGNVWWLAEDFATLEDDHVACPCRAWEAGMDGALPGVVMLRRPIPGDAYRQQFAPGIAEDVAEVTDVGVTIQVPAGAFSSCIVTEERQTLDQAMLDRVTYCPGIGMVETERADGTRVVLLERSPMPPGPALEDDDDD